MPSITLLADKLAHDFPSYMFTSSDEFHWSPLENTVFFDRTSADEPALLHELSHALLGHQDYMRDIQLISMERDAWHYAKETLAKRYSITITEDVIQDALDTYRDWLHARSTCPSCAASGIQTKKHLYTCVVCRTKWQVNDARICALRRWKLPNKTSG